MSTDRKPEPRIASHPDDPAAPLADRLLLALGMWPNYVEQLGVEAVIEAAVILRSQAHRFPMAAEDYGTKSDEADRYREALERIMDLPLSDAALMVRTASEALPLEDWRDDGSDAGRGS